MSKVKLITQQGFGSEANPIEGGSEKVITLDLTLGLNEHIRGVVIYDYDLQEDGTRRASDDIMPVVPYDHINRLVGRLMGVIDASYSDKEQREAVRSLIMDAAWAWYHSQRDSLVEPWRKDKYPNYGKVFDTVDPAREVK